MNESLKAVTVDEMKVTFLQASNLIPSPSEFSLSSWNPPHSERALSIFRLYMQRTCPSIISVLNDTVQDGVTNNMKQLLTERTDEPMTLQASRMKRVFHSNARQGIPPT